MGVDWKQVLDRPKPNSLELKAGNWESSIHTQRVQVIPQIRWYKASHAFVGVYLGASTSIFEYVDPLRRCDQ